MMTKISNKHELVLDFIRQFRQLGAENCFFNGMCWHFTLILRARFGYDYPVVYDEIANHFATEIDDRIYDITGDITNNTSYRWKYWASFQYKDLRLTERIRRDCIYKLPPEVITCNICRHSFCDDFGCRMCELKNNEPVDDHEMCGKGELK